MANIWTKLTGRQFLNQVHLCHRCCTRLTYATRAVQTYSNSSFGPSGLFKEIHQVLDTDSSLLKEASRYHFNGLGKAIRPQLVMLSAKAINFDAGLTEGEILREQLVVAMVAEMIHTASLVHDDVVDDSMLRRGEPSVFSHWGQTKAAYTGDYILSVASVTLAQLRHNRVMCIMSEILENLVQGEFMQLGTKENEDDRFNCYIEKSYRKTASLIANSCKAAAVFSGTSEEKIEIAFQYGKNLGIAFQLIDDVLDFISNEESMGKPTAADVKLGLATAPVLFAAHQYPVLNSVIMRRFSKPGDLELTLDLVKKSSGIRQTKGLARQYSEQAIKLIGKLQPSQERQQLIKIAEDLLVRTS